MARLFISSLARQYVINELTTSGTLGIRNKLVHGQLPDYRQLMADDLLSEAVKTMEASLDQLIKPQNDVTVYCITAVSWFYCFVITELRSAAATNQC